MGKSTLYPYPCTDNASCHGYKVYLDPGYWKLECWGASGGDSYNHHKNVVFSGGRGGYSVGVVKVIEREVFYLTIGGSGYSFHTATKSETFPGGFNGGGGGHIGTALYPASSGGGGTDIRSGGTKYEDRIIIAGGGGGAGVATSDYIKDGGQYGGAGGGIEGLQGGHYNAIDQFSTRPTGGTQEGPGQLGYNTDTPSHTGKNGEIWKGGDIDHQEFGSSGGSGGGGLYGGGSSHATGGAGGSGYIGKVFSYRNIYAETIVGNETIPNPFGGTEIGHSGHGFAKITFLIINQCSIKRCSGLNWKYFALFCIYHT